MNQNELKQQVAKLLRDCAKESAKFLTELQEMPKYRIEKIKNTLPALKTQKEKLYNELIEKTFKADCFCKHVDYIVTLKPYTQNKKKELIVGYYNDLNEDIHRRQMQSIANKLYKGIKEQNFNLTLPLDVKNDKYLTITLPESDYLEYQIKNFAKCKTQSELTAKNNADKAIADAEKTGLELNSTIEKIRNLENELLVLEQQATAPETFAKEREIKAKFMHPIEMMLVYNEETFKDFLNPNASDPFQKNFYERICRAKMFESKKTSWGVNPISTKTFPYIIEDVISGKLELPEIANTQNEDLCM